MLEQVDVNKVWTTITTIILAFVFVFGNSIRNIYEAVIFLFVVHPFDVGDALLLGADATWVQASCKFMDLQMKILPATICICLVNFATDQVRDCPHHHAHCASLWCTSLCALYMMKALNF